MAINEKAFKVVCSNFFKMHCKRVTSVQIAFERGFRIGVLHEYRLIDDDRWILCNEQLPEKNGKYLVTEKHTFYDKALSANLYDLKVECVEFHTDEGWDRPNTIEITAWMELPKAFGSLSQR